MKTRMKKAAGFLLCLVVLNAHCVFAQQPGAAAGVTVRKIDYHGWSNSLLISNGKAEVTIVPAIGRVMQFGFAGEEGVFWENRSLNGTALDPDAKDWSKADWINLGGDKTWPSPEGDWSRHTGRGTWRPPPAFDAMPVQASTDNADVVLTSPVDPFYGVRATRRVHLDPLEPKMTITTRYERISGAPAKIGIWVITQLKDPAGIYVPVPSGTTFTNGYVVFGKEAVPGLSVKQWLAGAITSGVGDSTVTARKAIGLSRDAKTPHKIGTQAGSLLWIGQSAALRIDSPRYARDEYPDQGSSAEVYTNPDPLQYVELEMLGPLHIMKVGDHIEQASTYTLFRRTEATAEAEARRIFGLDQLP